MVTVGTVVALLAALGATVLGVGAADNALASHDASAWLWSAAKSELARVNGLTGRVDTRLEVPQSAGHTMQVVQTDRRLILRDLNTGQVSSLDLATLQITATTPTTAGLGVSVALHGDSAFVVDAVQGVVRQLDPRSLAPIGEPVRYPPGITGGYFDGEGRLWIAVPSEGTVSAITPARLPSAVPSPVSGNLSPVAVRTIAVAPPSHDLAISTLDRGVAVLNRTTGALTTISGDEQRVVPLTMTGAGMLPPRTSGKQVPVTVPDDRRVLVVDDRGVQEFVVPGSGARLRPAVAWAGRFYCAEEETGTVYAFDAGGRLLDKIEVRGANGPLEMEVREGHLFINAPNSSTARVVDDQHQVRVVDKYANDILGGDPPPVPPPPPPTKPTVGKPSAPKRVTAAAGDARVRVSWRPAAANGSAIRKYVVQGAGRSYEVGANQRSLEITGLTNGETYRFSVHAVNAKGAGPKRMSNPVVPTSEVPDPPASVTAKARPDGTVLVKWPAANGQGLKITKYVVTTTSAGANAPAGDSAKTELVIPAGELEYGTQYAFSVVAVNERGAGSKSSPVSNTVVPFTRPGAPTGLRAGTVASEAGAISVVWGPAEENGRPVTKYVVEAAGQTTEVTGTQTKLTGLGNGQDVTVKVHAVNEAGAGPEATDTARTVAQPRVTVTGSSATLTSVTITFTVDAGGGQATCSVSVNGGAPTRSGCTSFTVSGLQTDTSYRLVVTAQNVAGSTSAAPRTQATRRLDGTVVCTVQSYCGSGIGVYSRPWQDTSSFTSPDAFGGQRYQAFCWAQGMKGNQQSSATINAEPYGGRRSDKWIKISRTSERYIPYAWINLDGGVNYNVLPRCDGW
ncbi:MAG TPA: fibronectin type III domain-containing protein [Micromonosporaceae bacterium]|nr:fibronectin type III domain-containing protein [Micromonosporaceae bacterium]